MYFKERINDSKKWFISQKRTVKISLIVLLLLVLAIALLAIRKQFFQDNKAILTPYSAAKIDADQSYFSLNTDSGYLYKSEKKGEYAIRDFLRNGKSDLSDENLFPKDIDKNTILDRSSTGVGKDGTNEHYFLTQTINNIPIYGSTLLVHIRNSNEIYSVSGNLSFKTKTTTGKITDDKAKEIALSDAKKQSPTSKFIVQDPKKLIFNSKIMTLSEDATNYLSLGMYIRSVNQPLNFSKFYIVDLENGKILYIEDQFKDALTRTIKNCSISSCPTVRTEGGPPTGVADADAAYTLFGEVYDYFKVNHNRDSYNANGGPFIGSVNYGTASRPNAGWDGVGMQFSPGMVVKDISWHELTHAIVQYTAGLPYNRQSGALNESMADIFGSNSDSNWTIGEGSSVGIIRNMSQPASVSRNPQPDKLFSPLYFCRGLPSSCSRDANDYCGVHINSGVVNKLFYLMTDGGSFNGCDITGIGRQRSSAIAYGALTNYLTPTSNFYDMYSALQQSCGDLHGATSSICNEVNRAAQSTEIDQQPQGTQSGPSCTGIAAKPATCAGQPTTVIPTTATPTNSPTPTLAPGQPTPTNRPTPTLVVVGTATPTPTPNGSRLITSGTPTPTPAEYFTCVPDPDCVKGGKTIQLCPLKCSPKS